MENLTHWLKNGCQRKAVALSIRKPMTSRELWQAAKQAAPRIRLRDVCTILRAMMDHGIVSCVNKEPVTGSLYFLTRKGRDAMSKAFGVKIKDRPRSIDWQMYSFLMRGKTRREVLLELRALVQRHGEPQTIGKVRRGLTLRYPITMNATIRAMNELSERGIVRCCGRTKKSNLRLFQLTEDGKRVANVMDL